METLAKAIPYLGLAMTAGRNLVAFSTGCSFTLIFVWTLTEGSLSVVNNIMTHLLATVVIGCGVHFLQLTDKKEEEVETSRRNMEKVIEEARRIYRDRLD